VSCIIPAYNPNVDFLRQAVLSAAHQEEAPWEIIVVDDGSTSALGLHYRIPPLFFGAIRFLRTPHRGQASAICTGVEETSGDHLAFLDADDEWMPHKLAMQLAAIEREGADGALGFAEEFVDETLGDVTCRTAERVKPARVFSALMITREAFMRVGWPDPTLGVGMTLEWFSRAQEKGVRLFMLPEVVYQRRIHHGNAGTINRPEYHRDYLNALRLIHKRKRDAPQG
jgi:glycosyltransferase involved in cell wall biosynthesis